MNQDTKGGNLNYNHDANAESGRSIAVVVPCYKVKETIARVVAKIPDHVSEVILVNDACPDRSLDALRHNPGRKLTIVDLDINQGVGGATVAGFHKALELNCDVIVKVDGDDQMDLSKLDLFVQPILAGKADYTKGNRFYDFNFLRQMPWVRILGNSGLSFFSKLSSGYWFLMDPTNGYTAVSGSTLRRLPLEKLSKRYFFESDMLVYLNLVRAVIREVPLPSIYGSEKSNLSPFRTLVTFPFLHFSRFIKRIFYTYFLRDFNYGSLCLILGTLLTMFSLVFGLYHWIESNLTGQLSSSGTVMLSAMPGLIGLNLLISFCNYDIENQPQVPRLYDQ